MSHNYHIPRTGPAPVVGAPHRLRGRSQTALGSLLRRAKRIADDQRAGRKPDTTARWLDVLALRTKDGSPVYRIQAHPHEGSVDALGRTIDQPTGQIRKVVG